MSDRFTDRVALIAGGASEIGPAVATQIASEGGRVALWDLDAGKLETAQSQSAAASVHVVDATIASDVDAAYAGPPCVSAATGASMVNDVPPEAVENMKRMVPMGRIAAAPETADLLCFMVSESCSFTTGAVLMQPW
ncbi:hypothetical protein [Actinoplanes auranticolor]|uniref:Short subunit dehydrogenase n=1 Tax=Actinoplanes auranticolor TaxID=47988 RepID=A0A919VHX2_9ACTN|nr:hypothetical protein [Actinoplanes auranticolor]GIM66291.1 hypothetical protein Aau02nite_22490 [Actinoplanes auranticolor]